MVVRGAKFLAVRGGENFFANLGGGDGFFDPKGRVKRTLLRGELKIVQQRGAKLPPGRTLNRGVQMKKNFVRGGQKKFSYGVLSSCACMTKRGLIWKIVKYSVQEIRQWKYVLTFLNQMAKSGTSFLTASVKT